MCLIKLNRFYKSKNDSNDSHKKHEIIAEVYLFLQEFVFRAKFFPGWHLVLNKKKTIGINGFIDAPIMSYSSKFKSSLYGPFREAAKSSPKGFDRSSYQLPVNDRERAIKSSINNAAQGADYLMVKPGMTSIDLIADIKSNTLLPTGVYQVSGEYASMTLLNKEKLGDYINLLHESLLVFKRAKADFIITYGARDIVSHL